MDEITAPTGGYLPEIRGRGTCKDWPWKVSPVLTTIAAVGVLTAAVAALLAAAHRRLAVEEDPRIDRVEELLPGTNCGACGHPGCRAFSEALVAGNARPGLCTVSSDQRRSEIATFLGVEVGEVIVRVARLACAGGDNVARARARYVGQRSCAAAERVAGGGKGCSWGCLGFGDCVDVCDFGALVLDAHGLPKVDPEACTACGDCVSACPKDLFSLQPIERHLWVACKSRAAGEEARVDCEVACDACGRCAADAPEVISMRDNLPVIAHGSAEPRHAIERCPTGAIVWLEPDGTLRRGAAAAQPTREAPRSPAPT